MEKFKLEEGQELALDFEKSSGLIPVIVQDLHHRDILMLAYTNHEALEKTLETGHATFWSRSRNELWIKGETSGDLLKIRKILVNCDQDSLVYIVERLGAGACHTRDVHGNHRKSCFYRAIREDGTLEIYPH